MADLFDEFGVSAPQGGDLFDEFGVGEPVAEQPVGIAAKALSGDQDAVSALEQRGREFDAKMRGDELFNPMVKAPAGPGGAQGGLKPPPPAAGEEAEQVGGGGGWGGSEMRATKPQKATPSSVMTSLAKTIPQGAERVRIGLKSVGADLIGSDRMRAEADKEYERAESAELLSSVDYGNDTLNAAHSGVTSFLQQAPSYAAAVGLRSPGIALGAAGVQTGLPAHAKYRARGATPGEAVLGAIGEGGTEILTELAPMGWLVKKFGKVGAKEFLSTYLAREMPSEQVATFVQDAIDTAIANPDKSWNEYWNERPAAAYQTAIATLVHTGALTGINKLAGGTAADKDWRAGADERNGVKRGDGPPANLKAEADSLTNTPDPVTNAINEANNLVDEPVLSIDELGATGEAATDGATPRPRPYQSGKTAPGLLAKARAAEGIDFTPADLPATDLDAAGTSLGAAPEVDGIPYEPGLAPAPNLNLEQPAQAERRVSRDESIAANERALGDVVLPEGLSDARMKRLPHRQGLESLASELVKGGGIAVIPDPNAAKGADGQPIANSPGIRTPSLNPEWFQTMNATPETAMSVEDAQAAVKKALAGEKLGVRQARVVGAMLDTITGERAENVDHARKQLEAARKSFRDGFGYTVPNAGEVFAEQEYAPDWNAEQRMVSELTDEAMQVNADLAEATIERLAIQGASNWQIAEALDAIITGEANEAGQAQEARAEQGGLGRAGEGQGRPEGRASAGASADQVGATAAADRRGSDKARRLYEAMSKEELIKHLLHHELTGIKNKRAFVVELEDAAHVISVDADSLKWVNDNMSPDSGDKLLQEVADALVYMFGYDRAYHTSGDEFYVLLHPGDNLEQMKSSMADVERRVKSTTITVEKVDGSRVEVTGITATPGYGATKEEADYELKQEKQRRESAGQRAGRGEQPSGARIVPAAAAGQPGSSRDAAAPQQLGPDLRRENGRSPQITAAATEPNQTPADAGVSVSGDITTSTGQPFKSRKAAEFAAKARKDLKGQGYVPVQKGDGWVLRKPENQIPPEASAAGTLKSQSGAPGAPVDAQAAADSFTPTHELPDGTPVRPYTEDGEPQPGAWEDADGAIIEDDNAQPIETDAARDVRGRQDADRQQLEAPDNAQPEAADAVPQPRAANVAAAPAAEGKAAGVDEKKAAAILDAANVTGKDRLDIMRDFRDGKYTLADLEAAYPGAESSAEYSENIPGGDQQAEKAPESKPSQETKPSTGAASIEVAAEIEGGDQETGKSAIGDFGSKIEGARKDAVATYAAKLKDARVADIATVPLSQSWPEPNYQKLLDEGADPWTVSFIHAARDEIPSKPQKGWKLRGWADQVRLLRDFSESLMAGDINKDSLQQALAKPEYERLNDAVGGRAELYEAVGHGMSLKGVSLSRGQYGVYAGQEFNPPKIIWSVERQAKATAFSNFPQWLAHGDTRAEAIADFKVKFAAGDLDADTPASKQVKLIAWTKGREKTVHVGIKVGSKYVTVETFENSADARKAMAERRDELIARLERMRDLPSERRETNEPRVGIDHRNGADVTPEQFQETFGFRGGQFGATILKNQSEAQQKLNETYDALMDMAGILGLPPKALSLNGELGIAFGARGKGGKGASAAHYEPNDKVTPDRVVINLTRKRGAGSLAHEWWHALDNYFTRLRGQKNDRQGGAYLTETAFPMGDGVRPEMVEAFAEVVRAIGSTRLKERSRILDSTRAKDYWSTGREMSARAFESYIIEQLRDQGASNDYLANIVSQEYWDAATALGMEKEGSYPYPEAAEVPAINEAFRKFFDTIETKETDQGVALFSRQPKFFSPLQRAIESAPDKVFGKAAQVKMWLQSNSAKLGVKKDELQWSGILDYLDMRKGEKVSKEEVGAFLAENGVQVSDVMLGDMQQPGIIITDAMREQVQTVGIPLFARRLMPAGMPRAHDFIVPDTPEFDGNETGDLAYVPAAAKQKGVPALPIRVTAGEIRGRHRGFGVNHVAAEAEIDVLREAPQFTADRAENFARQIAAVARSFDEVYKEAGDRFVLRSRAMKQALVVQERTDENGEQYLSVVTLTPADKPVWGNPVWTGRSTPASDRLRQPGAPDGRSIEQGRDTGVKPIGVQTEPFKLSPAKGKTQPAISVKKRRVFRAKDDPAFSRGFAVAGDTMAVTDVQSIMDAVTARLPGSPKVSIIATMDDAPADVRAYDEQQRSEGATGAVEGFLYRKTGEVFLVLDGIGMRIGETAQQAIIRVWAHEVLGHAGLRGAFGKELVPILKEVALRRRADVKNKAQQYGLDFTKEAERMAAAEEVLAELAETQPNHSVVRRAIEAIRRALRKLFLRLPKSARDAIGGRDFVQWVNSMTDAEMIERFILPARRLIETGRNVNGEGVNGKLGGPAAALFTRGGSDTVSGMNDKPGSLVAISDKWRGRGVKSDMYEKGGVITLSRIVVPPDSRNRGAGSEFMRDLVDYADSTGQRIALSPSADFGGSVSRLRGFYRRFGFVDNKGKSRDFTISESMVREPKSPDQPQRPQGAGEASFSRQQSAAPGPEQAPDETAFQKQQRIHQDKFNRFRVIQDWLKERGIQLSEKADVYRAEERYHGRVATRTEDFREKTLKPLIKEIKKAGFTLEQVGEFLHAQHAEERNNQIAKVNPLAVDDNGNPNGSGMTTAEAREILAKASPELKDVANEYRAITEQTRDILHRAGILSDDQVDAWQAAYQHYVPLKGGDEVVAGGGGKGFMVKSQQKRALGHGARDEMILENIQRDHERAIMLVEKNRVGQHLLKLALEAGHPDLITIDKPKKRAVLRDNKSYQVLYHGSVVEVFNSLEAARAFVGQESMRAGRNGSEFAIAVSNDPAVAYMASPMLQPDETQVYVDGHAVRVQFKDDLLARAYNNLGVEHMGAVLRAGRQFNAYLSKMYTGYSVDFIFTNAVRDWTTGLINLTGEEGALFAAKAAKNYVKAVGLLAQYAATGDAPAIVKQYRADGGTTGAAYLSDLERLGHEAKAAYEQAAGLVENVRAGKPAKGLALASEKMVMSVFKPIERLNMVFENAMRLSAYMTALESGMSREKGASLAKNATVNFNRKGELGQQINVFYLFHNASVQGSSIMLRALFKGKHKHQAQALAAGLITIGYLMAMTMGGGDDDEYEKLPEHVKERNFTFKTKDGWVTIPIPYGYGFFVTMGRKLAEVQVGKEDASKAALHVAANLMSETTVFGNALHPEDAAAEDILFLAPTLMQIIGAPVVNRTSLGRPVHPESYNKEKPDNQLMYRNTIGTLWDKTASGLNKATGGDEVRKGWVDVSPETLKYIWATLTGGTGRGITDTANLIALKAQGADAELRETPVARRFVRDDSVSDARARFWQHANEAKAAESRFQLARKAGSREIARDIRRTEKHLLQLADMADKFKKAINAKRDAIDAIRNDETIPLAKRREMIKEIEAKEEELYDRYVERHKRETEKAKEKADQRP